jgi:FkbM family methyltransferase
MTLLLSLAWTSLRIGRRAWYSVSGRNPIVRGRHAPSLKEEWRAVRGLSVTRGQPFQTGSDAKGRTLWNTWMGEMWMPSGTAGHTVAMLASEMRANIYGLSGREKVLIDCGANVGFFSRYAFLRGAERVVAFEPSPGNADCLRKNLAKELADGRLQIIDKGVWSHDTTLSFNSENALNPGGHHVSETQQGNIQIQVTSIDRLQADVDLHRLDYIKMDVEGAELHALQGAIQTIRALRPRLCVATEHTPDLFANALAVIQQIQEIDGGYDYVCTESHGYESPSRGHVLTPYSVLFEPAQLD